MNIKHIFIVLRAFLCLGVSSSYAGFDDPIDPSAWDKHKDAVIGPIKIYKAKRKFDEDELDTLLRTQVGEGETSEKKLEDDFYLFAHKREKVLPHHMQIASGLGFDSDEEAAPAEDEGSGDDSDTNEHSGLKNTEIRSIYVVNTPQKQILAKTVPAMTFLIPFGNASSLIVHEETEEDFGDKLSKKLVLSKCQRSGEAFKNLSSIVVADETISFSQPIASHVLDGLSSEIKLYKHKRMVVPDSLTGMAHKHKRVKFTFSKSYVEVHGKVELQSLPDLCVKVSEWYVKNNSSQMHAHEATRVAKKQDIDELNEQFLQGILDAVLWIVSPTAGYSVDEDYDEFACLKHIPDDGIDPADCFGTFTEVCANAKQKILQEATTGGYTVAQLKKWRIYPLKNDILVFSQKWSVWNLIETFIDHKLSGGSEARRYYFIEGKWNELPKRSLTTLIDTIDKVDLGPKFKFKSQKDTTVKQGKVVKSETAFNFRIGRKNIANEVITVDRLMVPYDQDGIEKFGLAPTDLANAFEPYDIIDVKNKRLIAVKIGTGGADGSHLLAQALIAAEHFNSVRYRQKIKYLFLASETFKRLYQCLKFDGPQGFFSSKSAYAKACEVMNSFSNGSVKVQDFDENKFTKKLAKRILVHTTKDNLNKSLADIQQEINAINTPTLQTFFKNFDPREVTVVLAFVVGKGKEKIGSANLKKSLLTTNDLLRKLGYMVNISYIEKV
jgi:uncharacterized protein (TIGR04141 family)